MKLPNDEQTKFALLWGIASGLGYGFGKDSFFEGVMYGAPLVFFLMITFMIINIIKEKLGKEE